MPYRSIPTLALAFALSCGGETESSSGNNEPAGIGGVEPAGSGGMGGSSGAGTSSGGTAGIGCDPVVFEDPALEASVRESLGLTGSTEPITKEQAEAFHSTIYADGISSFAGIECFSNLEELFLSEDSSVTDISPLFGLTRLTAFSVRQSTIPFEQIASLSGLTTLSLAHASLNDISFVSPLTNLMYLWLEQLSVSDISPVASLRNLADFSAASTPIEDISPLANLPLNTIYLRDTNVQSLEPLANKVPTATELCAYLVTTDSPIDDRSLNEIIPVLCSLGWSVEWGNTGSDGCGPYCSIN